MQFVNNSLISLPLAALFIALFLMISIRRYRTKPIATTFLALMSALAWWSLTVVLEHASSGLPDKVFWVKMSYFGIVTLPPAWVIFTLQYANREKWVTRRNLAILTIMPVITLVMVWTNDIYHLMWKDIWLDTSLSLPVDAVTHNIGFWVQATYAYLLLLLGTLILLGMFLRSSGIYRKQVGTMLLAAMVPWVGNFLFIAGVGPFSVVDPTPLAFTITGIAFLWGLSHFQILDILPIAHEAIFRNMTDGVIVVDEENRITDINPAAERILGLKRVDTIGRPYSLVSPAQADLTELKPDMSGTPSVIPTREGQTLRYYVAHVSPINVRNHFGGHLVLLHDDTERRKAEVEGRERVRLEAELIERERAEELFKTLANSSPVGIYIMQDGKFCYVNPSFQSFTGYKENELLGRDSLDLVIAEDRKVARENAVRMLKGGLSTPYQFRVTHKNAATRWVMESVSSVQYHGRRATLGSYMDITERKQAEEALKLQKAYFQQLFDNSPDAIVMLDSGDRVVQANRGFETLFGYSSEEIKGWLINELIIPEDRIEEASALSRAALNGEAVRTETVRRRKDGSLLDVSAVGYPIRFGDKLVGAYVIYSDITERKQAEEQLRQSEEKYSTLVEKGNDGVVVIQDGLLVFANSRITDITGFSLEETLGKPFVDFLSPEYIEPVVESYKKRMAGEELPNRYEIGILAKDGRKIPIEINASRIEYEGRAADMAIVRDISERKHAEEALKESEAKYRTLIERLQDGVYQCDLNGTYVTLNGAGARILGFDSSGQAIGNYRTVDLYYDSWDRAKIVDEIRRTGRFAGEVQAKRRDGSVIWLLVNNNARLDGSGNIVGYEGTFADITVRKKMEEQIEQAAEEWRTTFDSITERVSILDKDLRIIRVNKAFADTFRIKPKELLGKTCYEVVHKTEEPPPGCPHRETLRTKRPASLEFFEPNLGIYLEESASPIFNEIGEVVGSVRVARDVTQRKRMQEQLMLTDRLSSIGELASGIAHELNNPLTSVIGFSQLLLERDIPDDMKEDMSLVNSEAQRAAGIVKNLLTFARKHAPVKQLSQINDIIEDVLRLRAYEQKVNNIEIERRFASNLPEIMVDYFQMQQVFLNIIINAEYFMAQAHNKGRLTITTKKLDSIVRISFADDGLGIAKENLSKIFSPFFTTKEVGKGTGLGLSICHGIVAEHGGQINAMSQLGKGATFVIELPIKVAEEVCHGEGHTLMGKALS
jgi:PAS domain S-box-containing protein